MQLYQVNHDLIDEPDSEDPSLLEEDLVAVLKVCISIAFVNTSLLDHCLEHRSVCTWFDPNR